MVICSKYDFSVLNQKGITYVAMTDRDMPLRIVFVGFVPCVEE